MDGREKPLKRQGLNFETGATPVLRNRSAKQFCRQDVRQSLRAGLLVVFMLRRARS
jgi:hypothetical protein